MTKSKNKLIDLLQRIHIAWRWDNLYTAVYDNGDERRVEDPRQAPSEGLIAVYNGRIGLKDLEFDLNLEGA